MNYSYIKLISTVVLFALVLFISLLFFIKTAQAASFSISPSSSAYTIGSTFDVSVIVDTQGQSVNAVQMNLLFPADKLQLVSPSAGQSIIGIYTSPPKFDNSNGSVQIIGGIPNGIVTNNGLITKLTFRVTSVGSAALRFGGQSQILLNDGQGTNVLESSHGATFKLELPPQQGPIVVSESHPDQEIWYKESNVKFSWDIGLPPAQGYSYTISDNPTDIPDDVAEGNQTSVNYSRVGDGVNYFHIKALRDGVWGGVSRYSIKIDTAPPALFPIRVSPNSRTFVTTPLINFTTTDALSGLDRYQLKIVPIKVEGRTGAQVTDQLFIDVTDPYVSPELLYGTYEVIVRAYDKAGNIQEVSQRMEITDSWLWFLSEDGVRLPFGKQASWPVVLTVLGAFIALLIAAAFISRRWHLRYHHGVVNNHYPADLNQQLEELQRYRSRYGKLMVWLIMIAMSWTAISVQAQTIEPPVIGSYSENIKTDELFYVSGRTPEPNTQVVVHLQSLVDGTAFDFTTQSDNRADWTYRHDSFLAGGKYIVWAHTKVGDQLSSPSPQVSIDVKPVAISWGGSRITYQSIYIGIIIALVVIALGLLIYIIWHAIWLAKRRRQFKEQLRQAEDSIKRGFWALRRDIEGELNLIKQAHLSSELSGEQKLREQQLREDLRNIEQMVDKEIWQVETFEKLSQ